MKNDDAIATETESPGGARSQLREDLLRTAITMVQEEGIDAISVREVARRAGVSSGAPFRHFKDRNALLAAIAEDGFLRLEASFQATIAAHPDDPLEQLKAIGVGYAIFAARHPAHFRVMHHPAVAIETYENIAELAMRQRTRLRALVVEGQERGLLRNSDPDLMVLVCTSMVGGLARLFVDGGMECPVDLSAQPYAEIEQLANAVVELAGLGVIDPAARDDYEKSIPAAIRGRKRRSRTPVRSRSGR